MKLGLVAVAGVGFAGTASAQELAWGDFKDKGCLDESGQRVYSSVLWNIPAGQDWIGTCMKTAADVRLRDGTIAEFPTPTTCTKSSINEVLGVASMIAGVPGMVYKPVGIFSMVLGAGAYAMEKGGIGAINVWGLFHVVDPMCPGAHAEGYIQTIRLTNPVSARSLVEQNFVANTPSTGSGKARVCFVNWGTTKRQVRHNGPGVGEYTSIGTRGASQCGNFPATARVTFTLIEAGQAVHPSKPITMSLARYEGGTVTFVWKDLAGI